MIDKLKIKFLTSLICSIYLSVLFSDILSSLDFSDRLISSLFCEIKHS